MLHLMVVTYSASEVTTVTCQRPYVTYNGCHILSIRSHNCDMPKTICYILSIRSHNCDMPKTICYIQWLSHTQQHNCSSGIWYTYFRIITCSIFVIINNKINMILVDDRCNIHMYNKI